jgi:glycosyltransferase involved in cell wall biosynthesis
VRLLSVIHGPVFGGAHNQALRLNGPLGTRGVETTVVLPEEAEGAISRLRNGGVETLAMPLHRLRATPSPAVQARFLAGLGPEVARLRRLIAERRIDLVQVHGPTHPHGAIAARLIGNVAVVWQLYDTRAPMPLRRAAMPLVRTLADVITAWGKELARLHPGATGFGDRLITVFPPVDTRELAPDEVRRAEARAELGIPGGVPLVGAVGVLNPQKGHHHLLRAAAIARQRYPDLSLCILGAPSPAHPAHERRLRAEARALGLADGRHLEIRDPGTSVPALLQAFDVFVMSSVPRSEGMPTAILEAMACGKPVVATDVGAVRELVEDQVTGLVVRPNDPTAIAGGILRLLDDEGLRASMATEARRRAVERFDLEELADLHLRAYETARAHREARTARGGRLGARS